MSDRKTAYALYIDPPLGRAGMTEAEARKSGRNVLVGTRPMTQVGRAVERGETKGFMKIVADADSKEILGAALLGASGDEVVHGILDVMYAKAPYTVMQTNGADPPDGLGTLADSDRRDEIDQIILYTLGELITVERYVPLIMAAFSLAFPMLFCSCRITLRLTSTGLEITRVCNVCNLDPLKV